MPPFHSTLPSFVRVGTAAVDVDPTHTVESKNCAYTKNGLDEAVAIATHLTKSLILSPSGFQSRGCHLSC
jgi:hypothetical protein